MSTQTDKGAFIYGLDYSNDYLLDRWNYYDHGLCPEQGYVHSLNYFLDKPGLETEIEYLNNGYYKPNDAFKRVYKAQMDECIQRCSLISDYQCMYAHGIARIYNSNGNRPNMPGELKTFFLLTMDRHASSGEQVYFHCTYGTSSRGEGIPAIGDINNNDSHLTNGNGNGNRWCLDGDVYASHTVTYHGFDFNDQPENRMTPLMIEQGSQERDQFCGQMGEMCIAVPLSASPIDRSLVTMSSPVPFKIVSDDIGNVIAREVIESNISSAYLASFEEMNEVCLQDSTCIGYNFEALDLSNGYDPLNGKNYKMTVYVYPTDPKAIIQETISYYRSNIGWHKENAQDPIFEKVNQNDGSSGMVLKLTDCSIYEDPDTGPILEPTCEDGHIKVINSAEEIPLGFRIASAQEATKNLNNLRDLQIEYQAKLADGYVNGETHYRQDWGYTDVNQAYYNPDYCDKNSCDDTVIICTHAREQQPKPAPCRYLEDDCYIWAVGFIQKWSGNQLQDQCRLATAEEVYENLDYYLTEIGYPWADSFVEFGILDGVMDRDGNIAFESLTGTFDDDDMKGFQYPQYVAIVKDIRD